MGTDKVLLYARFDDSTNFPIDTKFAQVGILKNPETFSGAGTTFTGNAFSSLFAVGLSSNRTVTIGEKLDKIKVTMLRQKVMLHLLIVKLRF